MGVIKELAAETRDLPLSEGLRREAQGFIRCIGSADGAEGVVAFLEKRQPEFTGKLKAAVLHEVGKPLSVEDVPEPEAGEGQSVVDVKAAGINFADVLIRNGQYPQPPPLPVILGNEVAGDVERPAGARIRARQRGWLRGEGRGRRRVDLRPSRCGQLRGRCVLSDHLPDRVDPA